MAIVDDSIVTMKVTSTDFTGLGDWSAQPPLNGIAYGVGEGSTASVLWSNGLQATNLPLATLDEVVTAATPTQDLFGSTVTVAGASPSYEGIVVAAYSRSGAQECVLVKSVATGAFRELAADVVVVVPGH